MSIKAVIFDLDGVIVSTDEYHYKAWMQIAYEEEIYFDREINERLRGVSRMESLEIILSRSEKQYTTKEKEELAERKNRHYRVMLESLSPADIMPGVMKVLDSLKNRNIKVAIGSSSKNTRVILNKIGLKGYFDAVADGCDICKSKPDTEVFLLAAERLNIAPKYCVVVEDADAGIEAALAAGMKVVGVGFASANKKAHCRMKDLTFFKLKSV